VQLRLHGTPEEIVTTLAVLAEIPDIRDIRDISKPYSDRFPSRLHRVYLTASRHPKESK
jgi:hypothetical protein